MVCCVHLHRHREASEHGGSASLEECSHALLDRGDSLAKGADVCIGFCFGGSVSLCLFVADSRCLCDGCLGLGAIRLCLFEFGCELLLLGGSFLDGRLELRNLSFC